MRSVGLKTLKNRLSEYVRLAAQGEIVLIADHDRVVAELCPPRHVSGTSVSDVLLAQAVKEGALTPALSPPCPPPTGIALAKLKDLLAGLDKDRER